MSENNEKALESAPLGKKSTYINQYTPELLFPVPRKGKREEIGILDKLPFGGFDLWNAFEISWLNFKGKPVVAIAEFRVPCETPNIIESKSFKLYLNSFNNSRFESFEQVTEILKRDLSKAAGGPVSVTLIPLHKAYLEIASLSGDCLDHLDIDCTDYQPRADYLSTSSEIVEETLYTDLLKSNCL